MTTDTTGSNVEPIRKDTFKLFRELGGDAAKGVDSMPKFALSLTEQASNGVISLDKDTDGNDDAVRAYEAYEEGRTKKKVYADKKAGNGSKKVQISKARLFLRLGTYPNADGVLAVSDAIKLHTDMAAKGFEVRGAYNALQEVARTQLKTDRQLSSDELRECITPAEGAEKDAESEIRRAFKTIDRLVTGEGGIVDQDANTLAAHKALKSRLAAFTAANELTAARELIAKADALKASMPELVEVAA